MCKVSRGEVCYQRDAFFNHPPFMVHMLQLFLYLERRTGMPFPFWLRLPAILADPLTVILVWRLLLPSAGQRGRWLALLLLAAAPPLIMISGFHGNTDPAMICFVVLAVYLLERRAPPPLAGMAFAIALSIKVVPVIFLPVILFSLATWRARLAFCAAAAGTWIAGALPYLLRVPELIARHVFGYGGFSGQWGITRLWALRAARLHREATWDELVRGPYTDNGKFIILVGIVAAAIWMNRSAASRPTLFVQCGLVAFLFLSLSPSFGVQYLAWLMPWVVALGVRATLVLYATSSIFLFAVYTSWSGGFPWHYAEAPYNGSWWHGPVIGLELLCWASVVAILLTYVVRILRREGDLYWPGGWQGR